MVSNSELASRFVSGATSGKGSNMFIEGDTIYSYGYHFPIAKKIRVNGMVYYLFNVDGYSSTTAKQKSYVRREIPENLIIELSGANLDNIDKQLQNNFIEIRELQDKNTRARKEDVKYSNNMRIAFLQRQNTMLRNLR